MSDPMDQAVAHWQRRDSIRDEIVWMLRSWSCPASASSSTSWIAAWFVLIASALLVLSLFTRPVAFVLSGVMAFAYWIAHALQSFFPVLNGGDAAILDCFLFLYLAFAGPGPWSIDAMWAKKGLATS